MQSLAGGSHVKYALSPDEYAFAALNLYLDIMTFITVLLIWIGGAVTTNDNK